MGKACGSGDTCLTKSTYQGKRGFFAYFPRSMSANWYDMRMEGELLVSGNLKKSIFDLGAEGLFGMRVSSRRHDIFMNIEKNLESITGPNSCNIFWTFEYLGCRSFNGLAEVRVRE